MDTLSQSVAFLVCNDKDDYEEGCKCVGGFGGFGGGLVEVNIWFNRFTKSILLPSIARLKVTSLLFSSGMVIFFEE